MLVNLTNEAKKLLIEAAKDPNGSILRLETMSGLIIQTNEINLNEAATPRSTATWEDALQQLVGHRFVTANGPGQVYEVTKIGFDYADSISLD